MTDYVSVLPSRHNVTLTQWLPVAAVGLSEVQVEAAAADENHSRSR